MHLEGVVPIGVLVGKLVVVAVVPGDPSPGTGKQRRVEHLAVIGGGVLPRDEIGAEAELLEDDGSLEGSGQLAVEGSRQELANLVVKCWIDMRAEKVDDRSERPQRITVVTAGHLESPGPVSERHRLPGA